MRSLLFVTAFLIGCSSAPPASGSRPADPNEAPPTTRDPGASEDRSPLPPTPPPEQGATGAGGGLKADGASCLASEECTSGICEGEGCGDTKPGTCAPANRACTRDLRPYCGCDGVTFRTSGSCPGRRFAYKGECTTGK